MITKDELLLKNKKIAKKADDLLNWKDILGGVKGVVLEAVDRSILENGLNVGVHYLPEHLYDEVNVAYDIFLDNDFDKGELNLLPLKNAVIDELGGTPGCIVLCNAINTVEELGTFYLKTAAKDDSVGGGGPKGQPGGGG